MATRTRKNNANLISLPTLGQPWTLNIVAPRPQGFDSINSVTITGLAQNLDTQAIFGVVNETTGISYPLNGQVDAERLVTFFVTIDSDVYFFRGSLDRDTGHVAGHFRKIPDDENEDGNWSAQAQGGGEDDDARPNPKSRHRRSR